MRTEIIEIYSDKSNAVVLRHPERKFPGVLIQGDSLYALCRQADEVCTSSRLLSGEDAYEELNELRNKLWGYLTHYKCVLAEHQLPLPFSEDSKP